MKRRGVTILEILIAAAVSTVLIIVLYRLLLSQTRISEKMLDTLGYLRDASLLMEHVKRDIRSASRNSPRETIMGTSPRILTYNTSGVETDIKYEFDKEKRLVTRRGDDGRITTFGLGRTSGAGHITEFEVKPVEGKGNESFFQVVVGFASPQRVDQEERGEVDAASRPRHHRVQALVNRRTPSETDDKWKAAFR